jgi:hypothetical protein
LEQGLNKLKRAGRQVYDTVSKDLMAPLARPDPAGGPAQLSNAQRVAAGCLSGAAAALAVYPMETLRTQMSVGNHPPGLGYAGLARSIIRRGRPPPRGGAPRASVVGAVEGGPGPAAARAASCSATGIRTFRTRLPKRVRCAHTYPRLQGPGRARRSQGWGGLYQGFQAGLASSALGCGMGFATYEALTVAYRRGLQRPPTPSERGTLAGCAAFCVLSACMPLEVVMRRLQARPRSKGAPRRPDGSDACCCGAAARRLRARPRSRGDPRRPDVLNACCCKAAVRRLRARLCLSARARHAGRAPRPHAAGGWAAGVRSCLMGLLFDTRLPTHHKAGGHRSACSTEDAACGRHTAQCKYCSLMSGSSDSADPRLRRAQSRSLPASCQVQGSPGFPVMYRGPLDCARQIAASEGLRGFYRRAALACGHGI